MNLGEQYSNLSPAAPWPGGAVFTAEGPDGKKVYIREASGPEAGAAPFLSHPGMPVYIETVTVSEGGAEKKFVVYEYFEGESLTSIMEKGGKYTEFEALKIGYETARVLKYLHGLSPRTAHGAVSPGAVFLAKGGRICLCGCAASGEPGDDLKKLATLLRVLSKAPKGGPFSTGYLKIAECLELPGADAGYALQIMESMAASPIFQPMAPADMTARKKLSRYAWSAAAVVFVIVFIAALKVRFEVWPEMRARLNISRATKLAQDFPCTLVPVPESNPALGRNLVFNPGLEGPCGWQAYGGFKRSMIARGSSHGGIYYFTEKGTEGSIYQDVDISQFTTRIARGGCKVKFSGYLRAEGRGRDGEPYLYGYAMRAEGDYTYLSDFEPVSSNKWTLASSEWPLPAGAKKIRIFLQASSYSGTFFHKKANFDDLSVEVNCP